MSPREKLIGLGMLPWPQWLGGLAIIVAVLVVMTVVIAVAARFADRLIAWAVARDVEDERAAREAEIERYRQAAISAYRDN